MPDNIPVFSNPQTITLDHSEQLAVFAVRQDGTTRVFYDMEALVLQYAPMVAERIREAEATGDQNLYNQCAAVSAMLLSMNDSFDELRMEYDFTR